MTSLEIKRNAGEAQPHPEHESKSNMQKKDEPLCHCKSRGEGDDTSESDWHERLTEGQSNNQMTAKPEESEGACINKVGKKSKEQQQAGPEHSSCCKELELVNRRLISSSSNYGFHLASVLLPWNLTMYLFYLL
ncbi:hypothetical protein SAY87_008173 [Trapa incisa]|uniref:Uncharacterized protein n=2 Tax=Trapa TaxID=22665 RepID=A0AAN7QV72_TRANT|nr:hypothetical protein SAY87_008173 [Trapa incisa]KAK4776403.1 hypothetical protein SAY86_005091 [Trapa natans]